MRQATADRALRRYVDSLAIFDFLRQEQIEEPIVAVGFSIGSGVAAYLTRLRPVAGLILVTPI